MEYKKIEGINLKLTGSDQVNQKRMNDIFIEATEHLSTSWIGQISGFSSDILTREEETTFIKFLSTIWVDKSSRPNEKSSFNYSGLCVRPLIPHLDFNAGYPQEKRVDGQTDILHRNWKQPPTDNIRLGYDPHRDRKQRTLMANQKILSDGRIGTIVHGGDFLVYKTKNMGMKIIGIYGIQIPDKCHVSSIEIWEEGRKLIEQLYLDGHEGTTQKLFYKLVLGYQDYTRGKNKEEVDKLKSENYEIFFNFKSHDDEDVYDNKDYIKILGYVCEPLGMYTIPQS